MTEACLMNTSKYPSNVFFTVVAQKKFRAAQTLPPADKSRALKASE